MLTQTRLRETLRYNRKTGVFTWRASRPGLRIGDTAGCLRPDGYLVIRVDGFLYRANRLAWLYVHGRWPTADAEHRNGVRHENRIRNLREATRSQNLQNLRRAKANNKSGMLGVCLHQQSGKWRATIKADGKQRHLGLFTDKDEAHAAYLAAKRELHPFSTL